MVKKIGTAIAGLEHFI